jgi:autotransporter-associated beta strand protein
MRKHRLLTASLAATLALATLHAPAADRWWDGGTVNIATDGDGAPTYAAGTWSDVIANWDAGTGLPHVPWNNSASPLDTAIFGGTYSAGTKIITLGSSVTVKQIQVLMGNPNANDGNRLDIGSATLNYVNTITFGGAYSTDSPDSYALYYKSPEARNSQFYAKITGNVDGGLVVAHGSDGANPGSGRLAFINASNDFTGNVVLVAGNLGSTPGNWGHPTNKLVLAGGSLFNSSGNNVTTVFTGRDLVAAADSGLNIAMGNGSLYNLSNLTITGSANLNRYSAAASTAELRFTCDMSGFTGVVENRSSAGASLMTIQTTATSAGGWKVSGGTLRLNTDDDTHIANGPGKLNLVVEGGSLNMNGRSETINGLEGTAGFVQNQLVSTAVILTLGDADTTASYAGTIRNNSGTGGTLVVVKIGAGTQTLTGTNLASGYTVAAGTLEVGDGAADNPFNSPIVNNAQLAYNVGSARTHAEAISGTGSVVKRGFGTLTLSGALGYAGATTIESGKLTLSTAKTGTGAINVATGANLEIRRTALNTSITAASSTLDTARLDFSFNNQGLNATAPLQVTGNLANSGFTTIYIAAPGGLAVGSFPLIKYGSHTSNDFSSFALGTPINPRVTASIQNNPGNQSIDLVITEVDFLKWTGSTDGSWDTFTPNWILSSSGLASTYSPGDFARFDDSAPGTTSLTIMSDPSPGLVVVTNHGKDYLFGGFTGIGGSGGIIKQGSGKLTLANYFNSYTGGTVIQGGTLQVGDGTTDASLPAGVENNATLVFNTAGLGSSGTDISGTGSVSKLGYGELVLGGNNTYTGPTTVSEGPLRVTSSTALGAATTGTAVASGAELWVDGAGLTIPEPLTLAGAGVSGVAAAFNLPATTTGATWSGPVTATADTTFGGFLGSSLTFGANLDAANHTVAFKPVNSATFTVAGTLTAGSVLLDDSGGLVLSGANDTLTNLAVLKANPTSGSMSPTAGLWARHNHAFGTNSSVTLTNGDQIGNSGTILRLANNVSIPPGVSLTSYCPGDGAAGFGQYRATFGTGANSTNTWNGPITVHGADALTGVTSLFIVRGDSSRMILNGPLTLADGAATLMFRGSSAAMEINAPIQWGTNLFNPIGDAGTTQVALNSTGSVWGELQLNAASITLGEENAVCPTAPVQMANAAATLQLNGYNQSITGLYGTTGNVVNHSSNAHSTLTVTGPGDWTFGGALVLSGVFGSQQFGLDLAGGKLTLTSTANSYAGPTVVRSGATLALSGTGRIQISDIEILAGGTFDIAGLTAGGFIVGSVGGEQVISGNGTVTGTLTNNGTLSPGSSIGTLTVTGDVVSGTTGQMLMEVDNTAATKDLLEVSGALTYGGTLIVTNLSAAPYTVNQVIKLFNAASYAGTFTSIVFPGVSEYDASQLTVDGTIKVLSTIPTTPTDITVSVANGEMTLTWPPSHTGWRLETQANGLDVGLSTNWETVPGSTAVNSMTFPIDPTKGVVFYRLVYP